MTTTSICESACQLCKSAQAGDAKAAEQLVNLHYERLYAWFRRLTGNEHDAADLTQKTFSKVWTALPRFAGKSSFSTWLHSIGHHVYVDWRRRVRPAEPLPNEWWTTCPSPDPSPAQNTAERDLAHLLYRSVECLTEDNRQTVHLHYYQGLSIAETAEALGIATSTVKYRLRQAIDQLRGRLKENLPASRS